MAMRTQLRHLVNWASATGGVIEWRYSRKATILSRLTRNPFRSLWYFALCFGRGDDGRYALLAFQRQFAGATHREGHGAGAFLDFGRGVSDSVLLIWTGSVRLK
jgi:hypothetical protein